MKKIHPEKIFYPDRSKIQRFLLPPLGFSVIACFVMVMFAGFNVVGFLGALVIIACVCLPFAVLVLPIFLFEKIVVESFTITFHFVFLLFRFKKVIKLSDLKKIREQYRNQSSQRTKGGAKEIIFEYQDGHVLISEMKYKHDDILELIYTIQQRNESVEVEMLKK